MRRGWRTGWVVVLLASGLSGCASLRSAQGRAPRRGAVVTAGKIAAVVEGPGVLHAYSHFRGGRLYVVPARSGGDHDCRAAAAAGRTASAVAVQPRTTLDVSAGERVCLVTDRPRPFELLWHLHPRHPGAAVVAAVPR